MWRLALVICCLALVRGQVNYCNPALCGGTSQHIGCNNNGAWSRDCPTSPAPVAIPLSTSQKQQILRMHNSKRNQLASGKLPGYAAARRMATIRWNPELARMAALNVRQCKMKHDECRNTPTFRSSGQNLASFSYSRVSTSPSTQELLTTLINMWWNEYKYANMSIINQYPRFHSGQQIGHFTAMAQEMNTAVGCALARYGITVNTYVLACNYGYTNYIGQAVYQRGAAGSGCKTGRNTNWPSLCKIAEAYKF